MATTRIFSPLTLLPTTIDVAKPVRELQDGLNPFRQYHERERQHASIRALIQLYESGQKLDDAQEFWIKKGKVVYRGEASKRKGLDSNLG